MLLSTLNALSKPCPLHLSEARSPGTDWASVQIAAEDAAGNVICSKPRSSAERTPTRGPTVLANPEGTVDSRISCNVGFRGPQVALDARRGSPIPASQGTEVGLQPWPATRVHTTLGPRAVARLTGVLTSE